VVFTRRARFPKELPDGVLRIADLPKQLAGMRGTPSSADIASWQHLLSHARRDPDARREHLAQLHARHREPKANRSAIGADTARAAILLVAAVGLIGSALMQFAGSNLAPPVSEVQSQVTSSHPIVPHGADRGPTSEGDDIAATPDLRRAVKAPVAANARDADQRIRWSSMNAAMLAAEACESARAAVLIENNAVNRTRRDRACAAAVGSSAWTPSSASFGDVGHVAEAPVVIDRSWTTLRSAADLGR
jgi:hypothetical protein